MGQSESIELKPITNLLSYDDNKNLPEGKFDTFSFTSFFLPFNGYITVSDAYVHNQNV